MRIAVAYNDGMIFEHFGHCECFAIYDYENSDVNKCTKTLVDCSDKHGHAAMANLMRDEKIDVVIVGNMGPEAKNMLLSYGIIPLAGYVGGADKAADMLILGQLPMLDMAGSCSGGCGGCSGCGDAGCGCGDDGGCGCH